MRKLILLLIILCFALQVRASECTAYLCEIYSNEYNSKVKIVSKKEFIDKYEQKVGDYYISSIVYKKWIEYKKKLTIIYLIF